MFSRFRRSDGVKCKHHWHFSTPDRPIAGCAFGETAKHEVDTCCLCGKEKVSRYEDTDWGYE